MRQRGVETSAGQYSTRLVERDIPDCQKTPRRFQNHMFHSTPTHVSNGEACFDEIRDSQQWKRLAHSSPPDPSKTNSTDHLEVF